MTTVHDRDGNDIGQYDGRFVYDRGGEKRYWIDDGEVFLIPPTNREEGQGTRATIKIATLIDRVAIDEQGATVFTL